MASGDIRRITPLASRLSKMASKARVLLSAARLRVLSLIMDQDHRWKTCTAAWTAIRLKVVKSATSPKWALIRCIKIKGRPDQSTRESKTPRFTNLLLRWCKIRGHRLEANLRNRRTLASAGSIIRDRIRPAWLSTGRWAPWTARISTEVSRTVLVIAWDKCHSLIPKCHPLHKI